MFIADTHCDTLYVMSGTSESPCVTPKTLHDGGVTLQTLALWSGRYGNKGDYDGIVAAELSVLHLLTDAGIRQVSDPSDAREGENCCMLSIEGCEVFEAGLHRIAEFRERGVRMGALVWNNENALGYPSRSGSKKGLKPYGILAVREMQRLGMAVDVSHLNDAGFYDLFDKTDRVPMASHSCCRALCGNSRNLSDDQIRLMIREKGYIGMNFYPYFLNDDGKADLGTVVRHIDRVVQMGGEDIIGLGSDFDGIEVSPEGLASPADLPALLDALRNIGYPEKTVEKIAGGNLLAYFARIAPSAE